MSLRARDRVIALVRIIPQQMTGKQQKHHHYELDDPARIHDYRPQALSWIGCVKAAASASVMDSVSFLLIRALFSPNMLLSQVISLTTSYTKTMILIPYISFKLDSVTGKTFSFSSMAGYPGRRIPKTCVIVACCGDGAILLHFTANPRII